MEPSLPHARAFPTSPLPPLRSGETDCVVVAAALWPWGPGPSAGSGRSIVGIYGPGRDSSSRRRSQGRPVGARAALSVCHTRGASEAQFRSIDLCAAVRSGPMASSEAGVGRRDGAHSHRLLSKSRGGGGLLGPLGRSRRVRPVARLAPVGLLRRMGGEGGIRNRGTGYRVRRLSKPEFGRRGGVRPWARRRAP